MPRFPRPAVVALLLAVAPPARGDDVNEANEAALKAAAKAAAPWVVKIETAGGRDVVAGATPGRPGQPPPAVRKGVGPTTGLVVSADGYIVSSAFNFANKPSDIFVTVPGRPRAVAKVVASDATRMLTLLKADLKNLPVPPPFPKADVKVGQWALALGRALDPDISELPSVSAGIVSAVGRIYGKAVQTDCKVSPVNYGGPLVALDGRVIGVLVPASPQGDGDTAGVEWYDSGIGFAVPLDDVFAALPRLKEGKDLVRGRLGFTPQNTSELYNVPAVVGSVAADSPAARAGLKAGDKLVELDGKPVPHFSAVQHVLGPKYAGDAIAVVVERGGERVDLGRVTLAGDLAAAALPFLGVLPMRDDPDPGVELRYVFPDSPAAKAKLAAGDRVMKVGGAGALPIPGGPPRPGVEFMTPVANRAALAAAVARKAAGDDLKLEVKRKDGKTETVTVKLAVAPDAAPELAPPLPSSKKRALQKAKPAGPAPKEEPKKDEPKKDDKPADEDKEKADTGLQKRTLEAVGREYWVYVPRTYDKNVSHGVLLWLHGAGKGGKDAQDMVDIWGDFCDDHHFLLVGPTSRNPDGWVATEAEEVVQVLNEVVGRYTADRTRVAVHGMGVGGQMAFYLGFQARDLVRGVATTGAVLGNQPKDGDPARPLAFFVVGGDRDPLVKEIADGVAKLKEKKFPVVYRELKDFGKEYLLQSTLRELQAWLDSLDRI